MVLRHFEGWFNGESVLVTAVLERTCVIQPGRSSDRVLVNKHLLFVEEGFTLAVIDEAKKAMRGRVQRGWRTNWQRRSNV